MKTIASRIQKVTSKGQITLPVGWRKTVGTDVICITQEGDSLRIAPARLADAHDEYTVFDAIRDNDGKGVRAADFIRALKKVQHGYN